MNTKNDIDYTYINDISFDNPTFKVLAQKIDKNIIKNFAKHNIHHHEEVELLYIKNGCCSYRVNDKIINLNAGEGIIINSNELHSFMYDKLMNDKPESNYKEFEFEYVLFHTDVLSNSPYFKEHILTKIIGEKALDCIVLKTENPIDLLVLKYIEQIVYLSSLKGYEMEIISLLHEIIRRLYNKTKQIENISIESEADPDIKSIKDMIDFVNENFTEKITISDICRKGNVSKNICTSLFKKYTNLTPIDYVRHTRLLAATRYLEGTEKSISDIAYTAGFNSTSYFTETFKQFYNITPAKYRAIMHR